MKCLLTYKLSLSLFSPEITFENTHFSIISRETKTEIMCLSLSMSLRIFVNPGPGLYNDCKGSETNGPLQRTQTSPIPGRLADQVPVSGGSPSEHSGGGRPNPILGLDNKSGKIRTETYSGVFVRGLRIPSRFSPCKTHSNLRI